MTTPDDQKKTSTMEELNLGGVFRGLAASLQPLLPAVRAVGGARPLAFLSEGAVAGQALLPRSLYLGCWGVSGLAIAADITTRVVDAPEEVKLKTGLYWAAFHVPASLVLPALIIHQVVHLTEKAVKGSSLPARAKLVLPVAAALLSIAPVVPAVDAVAEMVLEPTLGAFLGLQFHHQHQPEGGKKEL